MACRVARSSATSSSIRSAVGTAAVPSRPSPALDRPEPEYSLLRGVIVSLTAAASSTFRKLISAPELPAVLTSMLPKSNCLPQNDRLYSVFWILSRPTLSMFAQDALLDVQRLVRDHVVGVPDRQPGQREREQDQEPDEEDHEEQAPDRRPDDADRDGFAHPPDLLVVVSLVGFGAVLGRRLHETRVDRTPMLSRYARAVLVLVNLLSVVRRHSPHSVLGILVGAAAGESDPAAEVDGPAEGG